MMDAFFLVGSILGLTLALRVEHVRLRRLRAGALTELSALAAALDRRRAALAVLATDLPAVLPAAHGQLESLGRAQRAGVDALARLRGGPGLRDGEAAESFAASERQMEQALTELRADIEDLGCLGAFTRLEACTRSAAARARAVGAAVQHYHARRGRGLRAVMVRLLGHGRLVWA
jgi:hypothetical protein